MTRGLLRLYAAVLLLPILVSSKSPLPVAAGSDPPPELARHLAEIAKLAHPSPMVTIPAGWFLMGTTRKDDDPFALETQYDDTELPQRHIWLDAYEIDRSEVTLAELLAHVQRQGRQVPDASQRLIWHLLSVHFAPD